MNEIVSKTQEIYDLVKADVVRLRFRPDDIINEKDLAEQYQVSKTPVREALGMLVQEGYLRKIPRVGYLIRQISNEEFCQLNYLRYTVEVGVVRWILHRCTEDEILSLKEFCRDSSVTYQEFGGINQDFHMAMAKLTGNAYLIQAVENVFNRMIRKPSEVLYAEIQDQPHLYHLKLIEAMRTRDEARALELIRHECWRDDYPDSII